MNELIAVAVYKYSAKSKLSVLLIPDPAVVNVAMPPNATVPTVTTRSFVGEVPPPMAAALIVRVSPGA